MTRRNELGRGPRRAGWRAARRGASVRAAVWLALAGCASGPRAVGVESAPALVETARASGENTGAATARDGGRGLPSVSAEADTSLELGVYRAAGVPDIDRRWSRADYERCLRVFADLLRGGRGDLPRRGSPRSGALFARLVDTDNFVGVTDTAERAQRLQGYLDVYPGLLQIYSPANDELDFSIEQTELIASLLELLKSALDSSRDASAADAAWSPSYERQKQMALGVVRGASTMLAEPERYSPPLRQYLKAALARLAPGLEPHLEPDAAREVRALAAPPARPHDVQIPSRFTKYYGVR